MFFMMENNYGKGIGIGGSISPSLADSTVLVVIVLFISFACSNSSAVHDDIVTNRAKIPIA